MSDAPPQELQAALPHDPRLWARNFLRHPNDPSRPYDFYDDTKENFLYYLTDDEGPMNPQQWGDINVLLFARGCLKTFTVSTISAWGLDMYPSLESVVTAPVDDQREEVIERFRTKVEQSGMDARMEKNSMRHMKFKNYSVDEETGQKYPSYSHMKSRTAWDGGNKLRGLHGHIGNIDESQDVDEGTFSTFLEAIDRSVPQVDYFPTIFVIGTPKLSGSFFHRLWRMSDQKSWDEEEKEWVVEDESMEFLPDEMQSRRDELDDKIEELESQIETAEDERAEDLLSLKEEFEEERDGIRGFTVRGWHVDQHNSPLHDDRSIAFKKETYSKKKFENEVLANFYKPDNDLITQPDVRDAFEEDMRFVPSKRFEGTETFLGVDWGGGQGEGAASTVCIVGERVEEEIHILNIDVFDTDMSAKDEREQIAEYMDAYDVNIAVVDEGFGDSDREALQDEYGFDERGTQNLYGCWYGNVKNKEELKWNRFNERKRFFTSNKTFMVKKMAEDFKDGKIRIPSEHLSFDTKQSMGTQIIEQLTAPYTDKKEVGDGKKKIKVESDGKDDIFDALTYMWIAANKVGSQRTLKTVGSHSRPGY